MRIHRVNDGLNDSRKIIDTTLYTQIGNSAETITHSNRVGQLCRRLGMAMELPNTEIYKLEASGMFHDIGKVAVQAEILSKPGSLTEAEWYEAMRHPEIGYLILSNSLEMSGIAKYVLYHHERYDGSGYPAGLKREEIPFLSRIIAVVDSYDAMTNLRSYQETLNEEMAVLELLSNKERQFDPIIVDVFVEKVLRRAHNRK